MSGVASVGVQFFKMKPLSLLTVVGLSLRIIVIACGHDLGGVGTHPHYDFSVKPPGADAEPVWFLAQADLGAARSQVPVRTASANGKRPAQVAAFEVFAPRVSVR